MGATHAVLASEQEFKDRVPDCETGAMPPFGNLYDLPVFADESLCRDKRDRVQRRFSSGACAIGSGRFREIGEAPDKQVRDGKHWLRRGVKETYNWPEQQTEQPPGARMRNPFVWACSSDF